MNHEQLQNWLIELDARFGIISTQEHAQENWSNLLDELVPETIHLISYFLHNHQESGQLSLTAQLLSLYYRFGTSNLRIGIFIS